MSHKNTPEPCKLPQVDLNFLDLYKLVISPIKTNLLLAGIKLRVFDLLSDHRSAEDVAEILKTHPENTRTLLDGLAAFDLLEKKDGLYANSMMAETFLVETSPAFVGNFLCEQWRYIEPVLGDMKGIIVKGPQIEKNRDQGTDNEPQSEEDLTRWVTAVAEYERAGMAQTVAGLISELPGFPSFRKMLDLGGGPGLIGMAVVSAHPTMRGVIFDLSPVAKAAERFIFDFGMEDRIEVAAGDISIDPIGDNYDLILASASLYSCKKDLDSAIEKVHAALNPGGVFASLHEGLTSEETKPETMKLGWLPSELRGRYLAFERGEIRASMQRAGFVSITSRTVDSPVGPLDLDVGRKL
jgi:SAM-dependent methyltransferase